MSRTLNNRAVGDAYEEAAARYLYGKGYDILERNFRIRTGEIDIIAFDRNDNTLVFAEVKYRNNLRNGRPACAVTRNKQLVIMKTAQYYLFTKHLSECNCRFDVIEITGTEINHIKNAFMA